MDEILRQLPEDCAQLAALAATLSDADGAALVDHLKSEADRHWWINANRSLELADMIVCVGRARADRWQEALGTMARGDALKFLGRIGEAWDLLGEAGRLFVDAGSEVGWARTRIGRLVICVELQRADEALRDAREARAIFERHDERERVLRIDHNAAIAYNQLGEYRRALELYRSALEIAEALGEAGRGYLGLLYSDVGYTYKLLGDLRPALRYYERAREACRERDEISGVALAELNMAQIAMLEGQHRTALQLLHHARDLYVRERLPLDATYVSHHIVECYLLLNRYAEARDLAILTAQEYRSYGAAHSEALALLFLAHAEVELRNLDLAQAALDQADAIFASQSAISSVALVQLRRSQIALRRGDLAAARAAAERAAAHFADRGQQVELAEAALVMGRAVFLGDDLGRAAASGHASLRTARTANVPPLRYSAHLLLGQIAERHGDDRRAARHYRAALATVDRVQRGLTITLRTGFLEDKGEALRRLMSLRLQAGQAQAAFETLERAKSQALLGYLANREQFRWTGAGARERELIDELNRLREEHHWLYRLAHDLPALEADVPAAHAPEQARAELARCERRMREISERLHLAGGGGSRSVDHTRLGDVQACLGGEDLLVEFYNDGSGLWAFSVDPWTIQAHRLETPVAEVDRLLAQLQANIDFALSVGPEAPQSRALGRVARQLLRRLHAALIEPLAARVAGAARLVVVPYGALHYMPFHLLRDETTHLVERHEVVILPAAALLTRPGPVSNGGVRALAHSWGGRLPLTLPEAEVARRQFGGHLHVEREARRSVFAGSPTTVLHIAAHGEHRLDQPELSYVELADGQLYTDDLLQHDLSYELVVLSACETGRAHVAAGDELIGLGRGFLYAGAGALITSLWRVADGTTLPLMRHLYRALHEGQSKAAALRGAQLAVVAGDADLHPAFWGPFQLVGDPRPLSSQAPTCESTELLADAVAA